MNRLHLAEFAVLQHFVQSCDKVGLAIPGASATFFQMLRNSIHSLMQDWPQDEFIPALALARHHGAPTRLLDWTESSYKACFFAVESILSKNASRPSSDDTQNIEVWALNADACYKSEFPVSIVRPAKNDNPNLFAQEGLFTMTKPGAILDTDRKRRMDWRPLDEYLIGELVGRRLGPDLAPLFYRFTLSKRHGLELLNLLQQEGVSWSQLMPNYDSVVRDMYNQLEFQKRSLGM